MGRDCRQMHHCTLYQLFILAGGFSRADGGQRAAIPGTYRSANMVGRNRTHGHPIVDVAVIKLPRYAQSRTPQASIPYIWIFEDASEE